MNGKILSDTPLERATYWAMEAEDLYRNQYAYDDRAEWKSFLEDTTRMASMWAAIASAAAATLGELHDETIGSLLDPPKEAPEPTSQVVTPLRVVRSISNMDRLRCVQHGKLHNDHDDGEAPHAGAWYLDPLKNNEEE